jgi:hypothetical protein
MNIVGKRLSYDSAADDTSVMHNLLNVLENLFFSMKIPSEIISKYNLLKENAFNQLNLPYIPQEEVKYCGVSPTASTTPAHNRTSTEPNSYKMIDSGVTYLPIVK